MNAWSITTYTIIFGAIITYLLFLAFPAYAQTQAVCVDRATLVEGLKTRYKEVPVAIGISSRNTEALEILVSESGTWTVLMTMTNGVTCVMAAGHSWHSLEEQLGEAT